MCKELADLITMMLRARLKVLATRQQVLNDLFAEAKANLKSISQDTAKYNDLLKNLILQVQYSSLLTKRTTRDCSV